MHIVWISGHFRPRDAPRPRAHGRVAAGSYPPAAPAVPDVPN